jgi:carbon monoxide dehydrogenase subunit G
MAIVIRETFSLRAPPAAVWAFLLDPQQVVTCMPGAALDEVVDDRTFLGTIRVKVGPVVTSYRGRVVFEEVDEAARTVRIAAEGRESTGSGSARATMSSRISRLPDGGTEVVAEANAEITGRIMQFGQGMIQGVSHQLFLDFVACTRERLDAPEGGAPGAAAARAGQPVSIVPVVLRTVWAAIARLFRRLFRRGGGAPPA